MRLSAAEEAASQLVVSGVSSIMQSGLRKASVSILGSRSTGLATPLSDFDFSVHRGDTTEEDRQPPKKERHTVLTIVARLFQSSSQLSKTSYIRARVPIVKARHRITGLDIQIQSMNSYLPSQEYTAVYLAELPALRPLYILIRYHLEIRGLATPSEGGLGSYSLLMMIATALKHSSGRFAADDLAGQLLYVLDFFGNADLYKTGFSANPPRLFDKIKKGRTKQEQEMRSRNPQLHGIDSMETYNKDRPYLLCLQDPADYVNDLGKNAFLIKHVQACFRDNRELILKKAKNQQDRINRGEDVRTVSTLRWLVGADYRKFELGRSKMERSADPSLQEDKDYSPDRIKSDMQNRLADYKIRHDTPLTN